VVGSTAKLLKFAQQSDDQTFLVVTESGILHQMQKSCPSKTFIPVPPDDATCACNECSFMKLMSLQKVYNTLCYEWPSVNVPADIAKRAVKSIDRMLEISEKLGL
jgi:quinolinate synthase